MVTDLFALAQKRDPEGLWITLDFIPWSGSIYRVCGWLAGVRNYAAIQPVSPPRGLPPDLGFSYQAILDAAYEDREDKFSDDRRWLGEHDFSWLAMEELLAVNYDQIVEDRRCTRFNVAKGWHEGNHTCEPGEGEFMPLREFLGNGFMVDIERLKDLGADRIVFGFGS